MLIRPSWVSRFELKENCWVFIPTQQSVKFGLDLKFTIEDRWSPPRFYFHLRDGGHVAAIKSHLASKYFCRLDLRHFFNHVTRSKITRCLVPFLGYEAAREAACNSTVQSPGNPGYALPYGFVQSTLLASLCLSQSKLGKQLMAIRKDSQLTISVYVDDIILSGNDLNHLDEVVTGIERTAEESRFPINAIKKEGPSELVSSFNIELTNASLAIQPDRIKSFQDALSQSTNIHQVQGILNYVGTINTHQRDELKHYVNPLAFM